MELTLQNLEGKLSWTFFIRGRHSEKDWRYCVSITQEGLVLNGLK